MENLLKKKEEELKIFRNVVGENKKHIIKYKNFMSPNNLANVEKNQGVARAKLRKFIKKNNLVLEYWNE